MYIQCVYTHSCMRLTNAQARVKILRHSCSIPDGLTNVLNINAVIQEMFTSKITHNLNLSS